MTGRRPQWAGTALVAAGAIVVLGLACWLGSRETPPRPLHADEAGQWSLLVEARPHSETQDRFHGPALILLARAGFEIFRINPAEASEGAMRAVPLLLACTLLFASFVRRHRSSPVLGLLAIAPCARFIQEPLLAVSLVWAALFWLREDEVETRHLWRLRFASGAAVGLALACKVTAALYLGIAVLAHLWVRRGQPSRGGLAVFWGSTLLSWVWWQSTFLTDWPALATWWGQLGRAFGLAAGVSEEPLTLVSGWSWAVSALLLGAAVLGRWRRRAEVAVGRHRLDPLLLACAAILLVHLGLPYKTPWLLMSVDMLVLVVLLPELVFDDLCRGLDEGAWRVVRALLVVAIGLGCFRWLADKRYAYVETSAAVPRVARAIRALPGSGGLVLQAKGLNCWPLPYYLRGLRVGYGDFAGADRADVRWLEATGTEAPAVPGYRVFPLEIRAGELWWLVVREPLAAPLEAALRQAR